jgi:hypothetical protein
MMTKKRSVNMDDLLEWFDLLEWLSICFSRCNAPTLLLVNKKLCLSKVVCRDKIHICVKIRIIITKFAMDFAINMVTWVDYQVNSYLTAFFVKVYFQITIQIFWVFLLQLQ